MCSLTGARALDRRGEIKLAACLAQSDHIGAPRAFVKIDREQPARVVGQQRIDPITWRPCRCPSSSLSVGARNAWFGHSPHFTRGLPHTPAFPLVLAARRPPALALRRFLPATREHLLAAAKEAGEQRELALRRPRSRPSLPVLLRAGRDRPLPPGEQLGQLASRRLALAVELAKPCLHSSDHGAELPIQGHRRILHASPARAPLPLTPATESEAEGVRLTV